MDTGLEESVRQEQYRKEAISYAEAAIQDLERRTGANSLQGSRNNPFFGRYRTIGESIVGRYKAEGGIRYIGEKVETPEKLAALMQAYRNPLFETMRFMYIKEGKVIDAESYSSHLPNYAVLPFKGEECAEHINGRIRELDADGYYLVHNHPSGDPQPSIVDRQLTYQIAQHTLGYLGHIITNHVRYALLDRDAEYEIHQLDIEADDPFQKATIEHPLLGERIATPYELARVGRSLQDEGQNGVSAMIYLTSKGEIRKIQEISNEIFTEAEFTGWLREEMRSVGAGYTCCVTSSMEIYETHAEPLIRQKYMQDMIYLDEDYTPFYWSQVEAGVERDPSYLYAGMREEDIKIIYRTGSRELTYQFTEKADTPYIAGEETSGWKDRGQEMKIQRMVDGKNQEITLTSKEIYQAYLLQEREFDKEDVRNAIREMDADGHYKMEYNLGMSVADIFYDEKLIGSIAKDMRSRMDKQDIEKETAFWQAVKCAKLEMETQQEAPLIQIGDCACTKVAEWDCDIMEEYNDLLDQWMEQVSELSYKDRFKLVLAMEFPDTAGADTLQDELYERFMLDDSETGFFSEGFRSAVEKEIKMYEKDQQKEQDGIDDILIF